MGKYTTSGNPYKYLYERKVRKPVEVDARLRMKLIYIMIRFTEDLNFKYGFDPTKQRNNILLDSFEEVVDNIKRPDLVRRYHNEFEEHNQSGMHISFPNR